MLTDDVPALGGHHGPEIVMRQLPLPTHRQTQRRNPPKQPRQSLLRANRQSAGSPLRAYVTGVVQFASILFSVTVVMANRVIILDWGPGWSSRAITVDEISAEHA